MATYNVPPDISEKEKIVGGLLTAAQLICILIGVGAAAISSFLLFQIIGSAGIIVGVVIFIPIGGVFALLKIKGLPLYEYLRRRAHHKKITKKLINHRIVADEFELTYTERKK